MFFGGKSTGKRFLFVLDHSASMKKHQVELRNKELDRALNTTAMPYENERIPIAASFGVETIGPNDEETNLIARADMAMYMNKRKRASAALSVAAE